MLDLKYNYETCCIFCGKCICKVAKKLVSEISKKSLDHLLQLCKSSCNQQIRARLTSDGVLKAKYHKKCYSKFTKNTKPNTSGSASSAVQLVDSTSTVALEHCDVHSDMSIDDVPLSQTIECLSIADEHARMFGNRSPITLEHCEEDSDSDMSIDDVPLCQRIARQPIVCSSTAVEDDSMSIECGNCKRIEQEDWPLVITFIAGTETIRLRLSFCNLPKTTSGHHLCELCRQYLTGDNSCNSWSCAWPSVIASILIRPKYANIRKDVWNMLPAVHQESYINIAASVGLECGWSVFDEATKKLADYKKHVESGQICDFITAMTNNAFPCVKCPAGCFAYLDECQPVSLNHYLKMKFNISFFKGDGRLFVGMRGDWPCSSLQLQTFAVQPTIIVEKNVGMAIMMCSAHRNGLPNSVLHVPKNPILGDVGFQIPDTSAAAILTPNVIRSGRMSKWTHSSHVAKAIGGYTGISTSTLALKVPRTVSDARLSGAECLAMSHRADIYHIARDRVVDDEDGLVDLQRALWYYEKYQKPTKCEEILALEGSTLVDVADCYVVNKNVNQRDVEENNNPFQQIKWFDWTIVMVHPHQLGGAQPVQLKKFFNWDKQPFNGPLLHTLVHCLPLRGVLATNNIAACHQMFLAKVMQYTKYCAGHTAKNVSGIPNAKTFNEIISMELSQLQLSPEMNFIESFVKLLSSMCTNVYAHRYVVGTDLNNLTVPTNNEVVLVYRTDAASRRSSRHDLINEFDGYHLCQVFGGKQLINDVFFR